MIATWNRSAMFMCLCAVQWTKHCSQAGSVSVSNRRCSLSANAVHMMSIDWLWLWPRECEQKQYYHSLYISAFTCWVVQQQYYSAWRVHSNKQLVEVLSTCAQIKNMILIVAFQGKLWIFFIYVFWLRAFQLIRVSVNLCEISLHQHSVPCTVMKLDTYTWTFPWEYN